MTTMSRKKPKRLYKGPAEGEVLTLTLAEGRL